MEKSISLVETSHGRREGRNKLRGTSGLVQIKGPACNRVVVRTNPSGDLTILSREIDCRDRAHRHGPFCQGYHSRLGDVV